MSDAGRRAAARHEAGDPHAAGRLLLERVRAGELDRPRLVLAARLGSKAARLALGEPPPGLCWPELAVVDAPDGLTERVLAAEDQEAVVRAALVALQLGERRLPPAQLAVPAPPAGVPTAEAHIEPVWRLPPGAVAGALEAWLSCALSDGPEDGASPARLELLDADGAARELAGARWAPQEIGDPWALAALWRLGLQPERGARALVAESAGGADRWARRMGLNLIGGVLELDDGAFVVVPVRRATVGAGPAGFDARVARRATEGLAGERRPGRRAELFTRRAEARGRLGDVAGAEADWTRAKRLQPRRTGPHWGHGLLRWQQGDLPGAARLFAEAASCDDDPQADHARLERARVLLALGKHAEAVEEAERVLARAASPLDEASGRSRAHTTKRTAALVVRSSARRLAGRPDLALDDATAAVRTGVDHWALLERARVHEALGDVRAMRDDADAALRLAPELSAALALRAQARALANDLPGALEDLRAAVARRPDEPTHREELGRLLLAMGRPDEGQRELDEARRLAPWRFRGGE